MAPVTTETLVSTATQFGGLFVLSGILAATVAVAYRWYVEDSVPVGLAWLVGLAGVALYLNTTTALGEVIGGGSDVTTTQAALYNVAAFVVGGVGSEAGRQFGDRFAASVFDRSGRRPHRDVGQLVRSFGRAVEVELPEEIDDVVGYDPVPPETKADLAGRSFVFPRGLTVSELEARLTERLRTDYAVGNVDVDLTADGEVTHLALGRRAAGIGPTLPPSTTAVAIQADPAFAASPGDVVQVWETDPPRRVLTAELRGVAGDAVTLVVDRGDTPKLDPTRQYRLVTLPVEDRPGREFAALLRAADETYSAVDVEAGSPLDGLPVGALSLSITAVESPDETVVPIPRRSHLLEAGETVHAVALPAALRRLEAAAATAGSPPEASPATTESTGGAGVEQPAEDGSQSQPAAADDEKPATGDDGEPATADEWGLPGSVGPTLDPDTPDEEAEQSSSDSTIGASEPGPDPPADASEERATGERDEESPTLAGDVVADENAGDGTHEADELAGSGDRKGDGEDADGSEDEEEEEEEEEEEASDAGDEEDGDGGQATGTDPDAPDEGEDGVAPEGDDDSEAEGSDGDAERRGGDDGSGDQDAETGDDADDGDADGGGTDGSDDSTTEAGTFAELKAEFESGDAEWADEIDDDPGGDMRLDE